MNWLFALLAINPFLIDIEPQSDACLLQEKLRGLELESCVRSLHRDPFDYADFYLRISRGKTQTLIDPDKGFFPIRCYQKIGNGGDRCIVSYATFDRNYFHSIQANALALESVGFHGYYLYHIGAFPNPTGEEIFYAGVPYSFKVWMMLEALKRGHTKILWIDSSALPLRDPTPLFEQIEKEGALFFMQESGGRLWPWIFPETCQALYALTGVDVFCTEHIWGAIFGMNMATLEAQHFVELYREAVRLGTPFLSCFPEQFVFSAILGQECYRKWKKPPPGPLLYIPHKEHSVQEIERFKQEGYYFYLRTFPNTHFQ